MPIKRPDEPIAAVYGTDNSVNVVVRPTMAQVQNQEMIATIIFRDPEHLGLFIAKLHEALIGFENQRVDSVIRKRMKGK